MNKKYGKVYLAGSGPGDPDLLTVKTKNLLDNDEIDVIIHDQLPGDSILKMIPNNKEKINAGKYSGLHLLSQEEINKLLIKKAKEGKNILRLKGGDPYIFGRGGEEAEELSKEGIEFEVIPGVTSAIAAPAYAGIPLSHRNNNSMILFITGHESNNKNCCNVDWKYVAKFDGTIVILMGYKMIEKNCNELIKNGMSINTPVAVIENGTRYNQKVVIGKLNTISIKSKEENIKPPAVIVIGNVVNLNSILGEQNKK